MGNRLWLFNGVCNVPAYVNLILIGYWQVETIRRTILVESMTAVEVLAEWRPCEGWQDPQGAEVFISALPMSGGWFITLHSLTNPGHPPARPGTGEKRIFHRKPCSRCALRVVNFSH